jgi:hypothetical protein
MPEPASVMPNSANLDMHTLKDERERIAVRLYTSKHGGVWLAQGDTAVKVTPDILRRASALVNDN